MIGYDSGMAARAFTDCSNAGKIPNPYELHNEESVRPLIFYCRTVRFPWSESWKWFKSYG